MKKCLLCGKQISNKLSFCLKSHCKYDYQLKQNDPKGYSIITQKNTPNFYYLLGLICTDGDITYPAKNNNYSSFRCCINVNKKDENLINQIIIHFGGKKYYLKDNTIRWCLSNKSFIEFLKTEIGLTLDKSQNLNIKKWFKQLKTANKYHFLRGIIDGDGSIMIMQKKNRPNSYDRRFSICTGSINFFQLLKSFLQKYKGLKEDKSKKTYYYLNLHGKNMLPLLDNVYNFYDNTKYIYLDRKYQKYITIQQHFKGVYYNTLENK